MLKVSAIIINYNTPELTKKAVSELLKKEESLDWQVIVIDNGSKEKVFPKDFSEDCVQVINNDQNLGFAPAVNQGLQGAEGDYVLLLNSDLFIEDKAVSKMLGYLRNKDRIGAIGPRIDFPDGNWQISFGRFPSLSREFLRISGLHKLIPGSTISGDTVFKKIDKQRIQETDWITGACLLISRKRLDEVGGLDSAYFLGGEDFDLGFALKQKGYRTIYYPFSRAIHYHGASSGGTASVFRLRMDKEGVDRFLSKNLPKKRISRYLVNFFYNLRIYLKMFKERLQRIKLFSKNPKPQSATIAVTYNCDSRCKMCNIWKQGAGKNLPDKAFKNLDGDLKYINLSGGEAFLSPDLPEMIRDLRLRHPNSELIISTNGNATERITTLMSEILQIDPGIGVRVSLDGRREVHDRIRGVPGMYDRAWSTIEKLRQMGMSNLGIGFTIMDDNIEELSHIYDLSRAEGLQLSLTLVQNSDIYYQKEGNKITYLDRVEEGLERIIAKELSGLRPKNWLRAYFNYGLLYWAKTGKRLLPTGAGSDSLFVDVNGDVYPSNLINFKMGSLEEDSLTEIWRSSAAQELRRKIDNKEIVESWIICTLRGEMKKHWYKVISWIIINKLKYALKIKK